MTTQGQGVVRLARCGNLYAEKGVTTEGSACWPDMGYARSASSYSSQVKSRHLQQQQKQQAVWPGQDSVFSMGKPQKCSSKAVLILWFPVHFLRFPISHWTAKRFSPSAANHAFHPDLNPARCRELDCFFYLSSADTDVRGGKATIGE